MIYQLNYRLYVSKRLNEIWFSTRADLACALVLSEGEDFANPRL